MALKINLKKINCHWINIAKTLGTIFSASKHPWETMVCIDLQLFVKVNPVWLLKVYRFKTFSHIFTKSFQCFHCNCISQLAIFITHIKNYILSQHPNCIFQLMLSPRYCKHHAFVGSKNHVQNIHNANKKIMTHFVVLPKKNHNK
jgi:hypothetical protein